MPVVTTQHSGGYDFIKSFDVMRFVLKDCNSIDCIVDVLKCSLNDKQIRQIIHCGIKNHSIKSDQVNLIDNIHKKIDRKKIHVTNNTNVHGSKSQCQEAFAIKNISCSIFKFLDFESKNKCKRVQLSWLYDLYQCASNNTLDINDLFTIDYSEGAGAPHSLFGPTAEPSKMNVCGTIKDLSNFNNITNIRVTNWCCNLNKYFETFLTKLKKIENVCIYATKEYDKYQKDFFRRYNTIVYEKDEIYWSIILRLLENNCNKIKSIDIDFPHMITHGAGQSASRHPFGDFLDKMKDITFRSLYQFTMSDIRLANDESFMSVINCINEMQSQLHAQLSMKDNCNYKIWFDDRCEETNLFTVSGIRKEFVEAIFNMYKNARINVSIEISFEVFSTTVDVQLVKVFVNEMQRLNMISCCLDDVKEFDVSKLSEKWTGNLRWYNKYNMITKDLEEFVCDLYSSKIRIMAKLGAFRLIINHCDTSYKFN